MTGVAELITKDELTNSTVIDILHRAYIGTDSSVLPNGAHQFTLDGIKMLVAVDQLKSVLLVAASFGCKPNTNRMQLFELCNRINDGLIMIRACIPAAQAPAGGLWFDHYLVTSAGLTGEEIVDEVRRFRACITSVMPLDTENILA